MATTSDDPYINAEMLGGAKALAKLMKWMRETYDVDVPVLAGQSQREWLQQAVGRIAEIVGTRLFEEGAFRGVQWVVDELEASTGLRIAEPFHLPERKAWCDDIGREVTLRRRLVQAPQSSVDLPDERASNVPIVALTPSASSSSDLLVVNIWSHLAHRQECSHVSKMSTSKVVSRAKARAEGYRGCAACRPYAAFVGVSTGKLHFEDCTYALASKHGFRSYDFRECLRKGYARAGCCCPSWVK